MQRVQRLLLAVPHAFVEYLFVTSVILAVSGLANANPVDDLVAKAQNPEPVNSIEIDGGYKLNFRSGSQNGGYYSISFNGSLVKGEGTPFKYASGLDLAAPACTTASGDRNKLSLRFEKGTTTIGGGLFEANGVQPLTFRGLDALNLRGTALVAGDLDSKNFQLAVGLESPPLRVPGFRNSQVSNWIIFGISAQRQENADSTINKKSLGLFTYRMFLGKAFGWRKSADVSKTASKITDMFLRQAPTYEDAKTLADKIDKNIDAANRTSLQQLFLDAVQDAGSEADWKKTVEGIVKGQVDAVTDQPTFALYAEDSGWDPFAGSFDVRKLNNLLTVTLDCWPLNNYDDMFFRLRYENGFERALPTDHKVHFLLSINQRF